jgi:hypothetical protein
MNYQALLENEKKVQDYLAKHGANGAFQDAHSTEL